MIGLCKVALVIIYRSVKLIDSIIAQIHGPETSHPAKEHMGSEKNQDNSVVSTNVPNPESFVEDANKSSKKDNARDIPISIEGRTGYNGR